MPSRYPFLTGCLLALAFLVPLKSEAEEIVLSGPPIWESAPLVALAETQPVAGVTFTFRPWTSPEGLRKLMQGGAPAMAVMPAPTAALFEANGIHLTLLSATITEGSLSVVGRGAPVSSLADLKGASLALPFKGYLPDLLMRRIEAPGPESWQPYYTGSLNAGMQLLLAGRVESALLAEPMASLAIAQDAGLIRLAGLCQLWRNATALPDCPPAGVVAINPALTSRPELRRAYQDAFRRVADDPGSAAVLLSRFFPELAQAQEGYSRIIARDLPMPEHAPALAAFYAELMAVEPAAIGAVLPKAGLLRPMTRQLGFLAGLAALVLLWSLAARETLPAVLPGPLAVLEALCSLFADTGFWRDAFLPSLARAAAGLALALAAGVPLGLLAWRWGLVSAFLGPLRLLLMGIPAPILAILCILWFDGGTVTVVLTVSVLLLPVFQIAVAEGMSAIDPELAEMARVFQVPLLPRLRQIILPAVWTAFGPALRVATANALRVTLLTELLSGAEGLGAAVQRAQSWLQTDRLFALVVVILLLIGLAETLLSLLVNKRHQL